MRPAADLPRGAAAVALVIAGLERRRPAVFLDYDGTLTPIVERPEAAVMGGGMRDAVRRLAARCPTCVVSGRDRAVVQDLVGIEGLTIAGSHGFDIWSPDHPELRRQEGGEHVQLMARVTAELRSALGGIAGALVEPKSVSVAAHYRLVAEVDRPRVAAAVERLLGEHRSELRVTPGRMVYELQPAIEWDKGRAVLHLLSALGLEDPGTLPLYLGDDLTDEDAFRAIAGRGMGILVGRLDDPELTGRMTWAAAVLETFEEVEAFLRDLAAQLPG